MNRSFSSLLFCLLATCVVADEWPQFRGPLGNGIANVESVPTRFGETDHVTWKTDVPGKAWSSPVIADGVLWATTAIEVFPTDEEKIAMLKEAGIEEKKFKQLAIAKAIQLMVVKLDFETGKVLETIKLTEIEKPDAIHSLNSYASPTPVIDDQYIYCHFGTYGTFCLNRNTNSMLWQRRLPLNHSVGPGSSPFIYQDKLVLIQDGTERQYVTALAKKTGETIWETDRPEMDAPTGDQKKAYCTPIAVKDNQGREQLICMGSQWIVSYDPNTGNEIWKVRHGKGFSVVPRPVYQDGVVYFSTGFGKPELWAVRINGSGDVTDSHVAWQVKKGIPAKPSPLLHDGLVYVIEDNGVASCFDAKKGEEVWKKRIGGKYSASPLFAAGHIFLGSHEGKVTVLKPGREPEIVAENNLQGQIMASPIAINNALVVRTDKAIYRID